MQRNASPCVNINSECAGPITRSADSPTKRLGLHTECIDQLSKRHTLLQSGAISNDQYDEMKESIMKDIKWME